KRGGLSGPDVETSFWQGDTEVDSTSEGDETAESFFPAGGYAIHQERDYRLLFKGGPFCYPRIGAHAHCDQLSICLRASGHDILTDSGTYCYHTEERWRRYFRGTSAHNTVRVDGVDQAEYGGPFLWVTHADGKLERKGPNHFAGSHNG